MPYDGPENGEDVPAAIAATDTNIAVTGSSPGHGTGLDYATVVYDAAGTALVVKRTLFETDEVPVAVALQNPKACYVTGTAHTQVPGELSSYYTMSFDMHNGELLGDEFASTANRFNIAAGLSVTSTGVYVTGTSVPPEDNIPNHSDFLTIKYAPDNLTPTIWSVSFDGGAHGYDVAKGVAAVRTGPTPSQQTEYVYVTGSSQDASLVPRMATVLYIDATPPTQRWVALESADPGESVGLTLQAIGAPEDLSIGNVIVGGQRRDPAGYWDFVTRKYDSQVVPGNMPPRWETLEAGAAGQDDTLSGLAVNVIGGVLNVFVTGKSWGGSSGFDYLTTRYHQTVP